MLTQIGLLRGLLLEVEEKEAQRGLQALFIGLCKFSFDILQ